VTRTDLSGNRLLDSLLHRDREILFPALKSIELSRGTVLLQPGVSVQRVHFPADHTLASLVLGLRDGRSVEAAMIGIEGALGGIISDGGKPAYATGIVEVGGRALSLPVEMLEDAKARSQTLRDHFARYGDCLLAQVLQSVACNAVHDFEARLARWLLAAQDRLGRRDVSATQDFIAEMLGVRRTYATRIVGTLERRGAVRRRRGLISIIDRGLLERIACYCYAFLRRHFERLLPGVYPAYDG